MLEPPRSGDWVGVTDETLPVAEALSYASSPDCGGVVCFTGTVRDHSEGRPGVTELEYEAYEEYVVPALAEVVAEARRRWPELGRAVVLHRTGALAVGEAAVLVVVATPHRAEAFEAGRFVIDTVKATAPIWKREHWAGGADWVDCAHEGHHHGGADRPAAPDREIAGATPA